MGNEPRIGGIVLAGAYLRGESLFDDLIPRPLAPVAQTPLIVYALRWLRRGGVSQATICANSATRVLRDHLSDGAFLSMNLDYLEDWMPRGAAGCAHDAGLRTDADTFVIVDGTAIPTVDLAGLLDTHRVCRAALTVVVHRNANQREAGHVPLSPSGIYVFDRRILDSIPSAGFFDIKEGLIPRLHRAGERVVTHTGYGACPRLVDAESYLALNEWMMEWIARESEGSEGRRVIGEAVVHASALVDPSARLLGPVLLGPSVTIERDATVIGPTSIGAGSTVRSGAVISRSVAWSDCVVGAGAMVDRCLLADGAVVDPEESLFSTIRVPERQRRRPFAELIARGGRRREAAPPRPAPRPVASGNLGGTTA